MQKTLAAEHLEPLAAEFRERLGHAAEVGSKLARAGYHIDLSVLEHVSLGGVDAISISAEITRGEFDLMQQFDRQTEADLREIRRVASMETSSFLDITRETPRTTVILRNPSGHEIDTGQTVDEFIRERTRLWRQSWIIGPLSELLGEEA